MNVALLTPYLSRRGGGVAEVVLRLAQNLLKMEGTHVQAFGLKDEQLENDISVWKDFNPQVHTVLGPSAIGYSPPLLKSLRNSNADIIHLHGLWQYPSYACFKSGKPYLTTVHGMLEQWAVNNSGAKKRIAALLYERKALENARCLQAFTTEEYNDLRRYNLKNPICIIPNGIDVPYNLDELALKEPVWKYSIAEGQKILLYLGRIHPKKGLTNLIHAWKQFKEQHSADYLNWTLAIAGWDQGGYEQNLKILSQELNVEEKVRFLGPLFNEDKQRAFAHANAFILPSFSEGLPMAVLEAWAYKLPCLITRQCNLPEGYVNGAAVEIQASVNGICAGLEQLLSESKEKLSERGQKGRDLVSQKFNWTNVALEMQKVYNWILGNSEIPKNVILK